MDQSKKQKSYTKDWENFLETAIDIIINEPRARASLKYNHKLQTAILKVTDDKKVIMFKVRTQKTVSQTAGGQKQIKIGDLHFNQIEQFLKITSKVMLKCDPQETEKETPKIEEEAKGKKKKGKGKK